MIEIREYGDLSTPDLIRAWDSLTRDGACPGLFSSRLWVTAWAAAFAEGLAPLILVGFDGDDPVGLAPLFLGGRTARFPVNFLSHRGEMLVCDGRADAFCAAVLAHLRKRGLTATLRSVPRDSQTYGTLSAVARGAGYLTYETTGRVSPYVDIATSWEEYLATRTARITHEWRRKLRKAERDARIVFRGVSPGTDLDAIVSDFVAVDARSWREGEGTSIGGRGVEAFYRAITRTLADEDLFRPFWLEADGRVVAFVYGAIFGGTYFALKTSFDEGFSKLSPGVVLFHEAIRWAFSAGLGRFDFVGETARWKEEWATGRREHVAVTLYPTDPAGIAAYARDAWVKPLARRVGRRSPRSGPDDRADAAVRPCDTKERP